MSKYFVFSFLIGFAFNLIAQDMDIASRHRPGFMWYYTGIKPAEVEKDRKYDRLIFDITYNDWVSKDQKPFKVSPKSIGFNVNFLAEKPITKGNTVSFAYGLSYGLFHLEMKDFLVRNEAGQSTEIVKNASQYGIESSNFKYNTLSIPLEIRFRSKKWQHAKFHLGGRVSYLFHANTNLKSSTNDLTFISKTVGFYDFNHFNASAHIRLGIRNWSIYSSYNFISLFKNANSLQVNPFQLGLSISLF